MSFNEELLAKLERWEAGLPTPPTLFDALKSGDIEIFAAFVLREFRQAAKEAVADRIEFEEMKLVGVKLGRPGAAGRVADGLARIWGLSEGHQLRLLGLSDREAFERLRVELPEEAGHEVLERLAIMLDIYQALHILLPEREAVDSWIAQPNQAPLFKGRSALEVMLERGLPGLRDVRAYLWAQVWSV